MITLDNQFVTFYDIYIKSKDIASRLDTEVSFSFNGVDFIVHEYSKLIRPHEVQSHIKFSQGGEVRL